MSKDDTDNCASCMLEQMARAMNDPRACIKPGQKISSFDATMIEKGGLRAMFNPGMSYSDAMEGNISKSILIVEDDSRIRNAITDSLKNTAFTPAAAPNYDVALEIINDGRKKPFQYALFDDCFPRSRGKEPERLIEELYDKMVEKFPATRIFAYVEKEGLIARPCVSVLTKQSVDVCGLYEILIRDAENEKK